MKILQSIALFCFLFVFANITEASIADIYTNYKLASINGVVMCPDVDGDGFSDAECGGLDCDDTVSAINPDAIEDCGNDVDDNCDGLIDEAFDHDLDGFTVCEGDCDDNAHTVSPDSPEICFNGIDDDCDGMIDCDDEDDDDDLVDDIIEDGAPGGDGNNDGTPDSWQAHVISIPNEVDGEYVTLETDPQHKLFAAMGIDNPSPGNVPQDVDFPIGFFEFEIELAAHGQESYIVLYLPEGVVVNTFYKFGPTPNNPTPHWYDFYFDGETGAQFLGDKVILRFVDGKRGDDDITVNGMIFEPGGPGFIEILEENIDESDGCYLAGSDTQFTSNTLVNILLLFVPLIVVIFSLLRRRIDKGL